MRVRLMSNNLLRARLFLKRARPLTLAYIKRGIIPLSALFTENHIVTAFELMKKKHHKTGVPLL